MISSASRGIKKRGGYAEDVARSARQERSRLGLGVRGQLTVLLRVFANFPILPVLSAHVGPGNQPITCASTPLHLSVTCSSLTSLMPIAISHKLSPSCSRLVLSPRATSMPPSASPLVNCLSCANGRADLSFGLAPGVLQLSPVLLSHPATPNHMRSLPPRTLSIFQH